MMPIPPESAPTATPSPPATYTVPPTYTPRPTYTVMPTATFIATSTETATATSTVTPSMTPTATYTTIPIATSTEASTEASTETSTVTSTSTATSTRTPTAIATTTPSSTNTLTSTAYPTATPTSTSSPTATPIPVCYQLTLAVEGSGESPIVLPNSSDGCPDRHYVHGEYIELTALPATEWLIERWLETDDDSRKTKSNTLHMPNAAHTITVTYGLLSPSEPIEPVALTCSDFTANDADFPTACLVGMVYLEGQPETELYVEIMNQAGNSARAYTYLRDYGPEPRPYYQFNLNAEPLWIAPSQPFTVHVYYNEIEQHQTVIAQAGRQQVDIVLPQESAERPIATINYLSDNNFVQGEVLTAHGSGQSQRSAGEIIAYRWQSDRDGILGEAATLELSANELTPGRHMLSFQVQDERGAWSASIN